MYIRIIDHVYMCMQVKGFVIFFLLEVICMEKNEEKIRKKVHTSLDENLYKEIRLLAIEQGKNANDLLEEGMDLVIQKYKQLQE